jgi:hypothetical protein
MIFKKLTVVFLAVAFTSAVWAQDNLAILPFTGEVTAEESDTIAELFSYNRELNAAFTLIPRTRIAQAIRSEQNFQTSTGMTDPDTIAGIGRQFGAQYVVAGKIGKLGNQNILIISILKIDDLRQIAGDIQTYRNIEEIRDKLPGMARTIVAATRARVDTTRLEKLAITPVQSVGNIDAQVADTLAQILSIDLIRSGKYAVYPRTGTLEQVQTEYSTQASGVTADENMVGMGRGENPRFVLSVAARRLGALSMFNAAIINLETGAQLIGDSEEYQTLDDGITAMENLTFKLTNVRVPHVEGSAPSRTGAASSDGTTRTRSAADAAARRAAADAAAKKAAADKQAAAKNKSTRRKDSGGAVFSYGILNLALGLGSLIQGDGGGWFMTLLSYGTAVGLAYWETTLEYEDELSGIPGTAAIGVAGFAVLYGFIRPAVVNANRSLAEVMDHIDIAVVPRDGRETIQLAYTVKF